MRDYRATKEWALRQSTELLRTCLEHTVRQMQEEERKPDNLYENDRWLQLRTDRDAIRAVLADRSEIVAIDNLMDANRKVEERKVLLLALTAGVVGGIVLLFLWLVLKMEGLL